VELLVAVSIIGFMGITILALFVSTSRHRAEGSILVETHQGVRSALDVLERDIRLAGVCLPMQGTFLPLSGVDAVGLDGARDQLTVRSGFVEGSEVCVRTVTTATVPQNSLEISVESITGFKNDMMMYIIHPDGTGEFLTITGIVTATRLLQHDNDALSKSYPAGSGVYAIQERAFAIDTVTYGTPVLTLAVDRRAPHALVHGVQTMDIEYRLKRNCTPTCDVIALPADDSEWRLVNELIVTMSVKSRRPLLNGNFYTQTSSVIAKPRNLLP
jgi:hypothetical protein